ncbi:hypothetical protein CYMTET_2953, partial [Cymbomonas tetramitiformis]
EVAVQYACLLVDLDVQLLRARIIKGIVAKAGAPSRVNMVNADFIAKQRGLRIQEEIVPDEIPDRLTTAAALRSISIQVEGGGSFTGAINQFGNMEIVGEVRDGQPYITKVGGYGLSFMLEGNIILSTVHDGPGLLAAVGEVLSKEDISITFVSLAHATEVKLSLVVIGMDTVPSPQCIQELQNAQCMQSCVHLQF